MTYVEAAVAVLQEAGHPLTAREITEEALCHGLLTGASRTPEASMSAALYMHLKKGGQRVRRVSKPGEKRALRGTVRWDLGPEIC